MLTLVPGARQNIANVRDSGIILNPVLAPRQVEGGMAMEIGAGLFAELQMDGKTGCVCNKNFSEIEGIH